ncbi:MAG: DUF2796 domain-containing protein [Rhodomicrobium sp.]
MGLKQNAFVFAGIVTCIAFSAAGEEHRQLGAHVHGHGRLNIAIEDKTVSIELEAPGADIVGFEHEAATRAQSAAIEKAKATLASGLSLFTPAAAAGCTQNASKVSIEAEHEHEHEHHAEGAKPDADDEAADHHHSEFHAEYAFECASPDRLTSMTFDYFKAFPNAQELDISLISPKGQSSYEVNRDKPRLDLTGIM